MRRALFLAPVILVGLAAGAVWLSRPVPAQPDSPRNLVFVSIDTLRADHLRSYGYRRETAPGLSALARKGTLFTRAFACSSATLPSHFTMMTGLHPRTHGVLKNEGTGSPELVTLAEVLRTAGFSTAAFVGSSILSAATGMNQGFEVYSDDMTSYFSRGVYKGTDVPPEWRFARPFDPGVEVPAEDVLDRALTWVNGHAKTRFFLFVHLYDPHNSYLPPPGFRRTFVSPNGDDLQRLRDLYDCEIFYADRQLQRLWQALEKRRLLDNTLVVVTGDHGEGLGAHQYLLHVLRVYDEELHVPLLVSGSGVAKRKIPALVDLADLFPTLLDLLKVTAPPNEGRDLVPLIRGQQAQLARGFIYGQRFASQYPIRSFLLDGTPQDDPLTLRYLRSDKAKLLAPSPGGPILFDLASDPGESRNVAAQQPLLTEEYARLLNRPLEKALPAVAPGGRALTPEERERLRSLGYLAD